MSCEGQSRQQFSPEQEVFLHDCPGSRLQPPGQRPRPPSAPRPGETRLCWHRGRGSTGQTLGELQHGLSWWEQSLELLWVTSGGSWVTSGGTWVPTEPGSPRAGRDHFRAGTISDAPWVWAGGNNPGEGTGCVRNPEFHPLARSPRAIKAGRHLQVFSATGALQGQGGQQRDLGVPVPKGAETVPVPKGTGISMGE